MTDIVTDRRRDAHSGTAEVLREALDPLRREFVRYIFSRPGQEVVVKDGYLPVTAEVARQAMESVGIK